MRTSFTGIDSFCHELSEEMAFVRNYLTLEKFRFSERFNFTIKMMPYVNDVAKVPSYSIFCFVENALKKGILSKQEPGNITLLIDEDKPNNTLVVSITDDGICRDQRNNTETFDNIKIINELFDRLNAINDVKISVKFSPNGKPDGQQNGCVAELRIPLDLSYSLVPTMG
jgi:LytS/YehU family sensor histidine kinase